jgi:hypothetical protein
VGPLHLSRNPLDARPSNSPAPWRARRRSARRDPWWWRPSGT